jgi:hypothetical protein
MSIAKLMLFSLPFAALSACSPAAILGTPNPAGGLFAAGVAAQDCSYYTQFAGQSMDPVTRQAIEVSAAQAGCAF